MSYSEKDKDVTTSATSPVVVVDALDNSSSTTEDGFLLNDPHR